MPGRDLKQSVTVNLEGNLAQKAKAYEKSLQRMAQRGQKHISLLSRSSSIAGRGIDRLGGRYSGLLLGGATVLAVKQVGDLEERYTRLGIQANISDEKIEGLKQRIFDTAAAPDINVDPGQIIGAFEAIVEKTGDLKFAEDNLKNIAIAMQATGATGASVGELLAEFQKQGIKNSDAVLQTIDILNVQGKQGAFTLKDLAALGPKVVAAYNAAGRSGVVAMKELGAALQVIRMGTAGSAEAATAFEAMMRTFADPKKIKLLKDMGGINIFDAEQLKKGKEQLRPINELMVEIIKASSGKQTNLAAVFDGESMRAFNSIAAEFQRTGGVGSLEKFMQVQGDGSTTMADSARAARLFNSSLKTLSTSWQEFANNNLSEPIKDLSTWLRSVSKEQSQLAFGVAKWSAGLMLAMFAGRKLFGLYRGMSGLVSGVAGKAAGGLLGSAASSLKPIPVYVVNGPGALGGGLAGKAGKAGLLSKAGGFAKAAGFVGAAGAAGYGVGTLINDNLISGTSVGDAIGSAIAHSLAFLGNDNAQAAVDRLDKAQAATAKLEVKVTDDRVSIGSLDSDEDIDVDAYEWGL